MSYVTKENMADILTGIAQKIGGGGDSTSVEELTEEDIGDVVNSFNPSQGAIVLGQDILYEGTEQINQLNVSYTYTMNKSVYDYDYIIAVFGSNGADSASDNRKTVTIIPSPIEADSQYDIKYTQNSGEGHYYGCIHIGNYHNGHSNTWFEVLIQSMGSYVTSIRLEKVIGIKIAPQKENNYSTDEQRIGTWIDGKPLYQKTYVGTTVGDSNAHSIATLSNNLSVVEITGYAVTSVGSIYPVNTYFGVGDSFSVYFRGTDNTISVITSLDSRPCYITVKYIKTTD